MDTITPGEMDDITDDGFSCKLEDTIAPALPAKTYQVVPWCRGEVKSIDYRTCPQESSIEDGAGIMISNQPEHGEVRIKHWNGQVAMAWFFPDGFHTGIVWSQADFESLMRGEDPMVGGTS